MKSNHSTLNILLIFLLLILSSCKKDFCPDCFVPPSPLRITFLDRDDNNMLDPGFSNRIVVEKVLSSNDNEIIFKLTKDIGGEDTGFWFLESINRPEVDRCVGSECEFYIYFEDESNVDTLNVLYEEIYLDLGDGCFCIGVDRQYLKYNSEEIIEFNIEPNYTGAAIIRK